MFQTTTNKSIIKEWDVKDAPCRVVRDSGMFLSPYGGVGEWPKPPHC